MKLAQIRYLPRPAAATALLLLTSCGLLPGDRAANPLTGTWMTQDRNRVTFNADTVIVAPDKAAATTMGPADCNGRYKLMYGRMMSASLEQAFPSQPDLQSKLKQLLTRPDYPVADVTCDQGGTTYLMLDDRQMIAVYRDGGVGGLETYSRL